MKRLPFILLAIVAVIIGLATAIESAEGSEAAHTLIYGTLWFYVLWGIIAASGLRLVVHDRLWRRVEVMMLHVAFIVILLGAAMPSETTVQHLREGMPTTNMPFSLRLDSFLIDYYPDGQTVYDYRSECSLYDGDTTARHVTISMNNVLTYGGYRFCQMSFDPDLRGTVLAVRHGTANTLLTIAGYLILIGASLACIMRRLKTKRWKILFALWLTVLISASLIRWFLATPPDHSLLPEWHQVCFPIDNPVLRSPYLVIHVGIIITAYVLYAVAVVRPQRDIVFVATMLLAVGIFLGAIWAGESWGNFWSWDPKESWALITLIVYAVTLHRRSLPFLANDRYYRLYVRLAFLVLLMTYLGVNTLLVGLHSYA